MRIVPTDNMEAWISLSRNPLTLRRSRFDTVSGLVDLMDAALGSATGFPAPALFLYGGEDMLIPKEATRTIWRVLPNATTRLAYYPTGHHLLPRDIVLKQYVDQWLHLAMENGTWRGRLESYLGR